MPDPADLPPVLEWETGIWEIYQAIGTQWRASMAGVVGLDYTPAIALMQARGYRIEIALGLLQAIELAILGRDSDD
jgi:hypothetical protein